MCKYRKCSQCGEKKAVWLDNSPNHFWYYCNDCVPRGSISNVDNLEDFGEPIVNSKYSIMWWDKSCVFSDFIFNGSLVRTENSFYYEYLDEHDRRSPSDEFFYDSNGFLKSDLENKRYVTYESLVSIFDICSVGVLNRDDCFELKNVIGEIFLRHRCNHNRSKIEYTILMSKFGSYIWSVVNRFKSKRDNIRKFYLNFQKELKKVRL